MNWNGISISKKQLSIIWNVKFWVLREGKKLLKEKWEQVEKEVFTTL